ncbi:putative Zn peptidase [Sphaerochaeta pleomorpha str. Grapes]|uniref:Putative Zn peptidase n=1 Tax=Sphaerochaeta pleomorpha (strain ATCC BAA-1885 / DSM 22778 / Grapes) TaxID=158190 RepID=G8QXC5_SPHPG|nr:XRE family transcriptional regulator [Sphaerochaeta pleomorpha]AEV28426.1 putative Zn peptidase [Sphaerochaeta pleomorpha str. Grapes]
MRIFNGNRLKDARIYNGLTVEQLADVVNVSKQTISLYENSKSVPSTETIFSFTKELKFPVAYFYQPDLSLSTGSTYFRSLLTTKKKYRNQQIVKMNHVAAIYSILQEFVEFPQLHLPKVSECEPSQAAKILREFWGLGDGPLVNLMHIAELNGLIITKFETDTDDIDAFSQLIRINNVDIYIISLSSNKNVAVRYQFDIAHEIGHILLHGWSEDEEDLSREEFRLREKEANEFASSLLLPPNTFCKEIEKDPLNLEFYVYLKKKWQVSIQAMLYRANSAGILTQEQFQNLMKKIQYRHWRTLEPLDNVLPVLSPSVFEQAVSLLLNQGGYTSSEFMKELENSGLAMDYREVEGLLNLEKGMLKPLDDDTENRITLKLR